MEYSKEGLEKRMISHQRRGQLIVFLADAYTASGAVVGFSAIVAAAQDRVSLAFILLFVAMLIDYSDGTLARALAFRNNPTRIVDGALLDHIVDFVTSAIAPAFILWQLNLLPEPRLLWGSAMILSTAFKFSRTFKPWLEAGFFTGIPSPWIHLAFYANYLPLSKGGVGLGIALLSLLTIIPVGFLHIARLPRFRYLNVGALAFWWAIYLSTVADVDRDRFWLGISFLQPAIYFLTSFLLFVRHRRAVQKDCIGQLGSE